MYVTKLINRSKTLNQNIVIIKGQRPDLAFLNFNR
jgi:hypothetical protein